MFLKQMKKKLSYNSQNCIVSLTCLTAMIRDAGNRSSCMMAPAFSYSSIFIFILRRRGIIYKNKSFLLYFSLNHLFLTCRDIPGKNVGGKILDKAKSCSSALELNSPRNGFNLRQK